MRQDEPAPASGALELTVVCAPSGRTARVPPGETLFQAIRLAGLPLGSSCDGDALCGWCRVRILEGADALSPMDAEEQRLLARKGADPDERIACLARVQGPVTVTTAYW